MEPGAFQLIIFMKYKLIRMVGKFLLITKNKPLQDGLTQTFQTFQYLIKQIIGQKERLTKEGVIVMENYKIPEN